MKIELNGEEYKTEKETVGGLLEELGIEAGRVAVEVNLEVIGKKRYEEVRLAEGDKVEVVYFVGGGQEVFPKERRDE